MLNSLVSLRDDIFFPLEQQFDKFFRDFFSDRSVLDRVRASGGYPKVDLVQENDEFVVKAAVPGVDPKSLNIEVIPEGLLRISGQTAEEYHSPQNSNFYVRELRMTRFSREFSLPDFIEGDPHAKIKDGLLTLRWKCKPKVPEKSKIRNIKVDIE
jgi:HSP20 family protein